MSTVFIAHESQNKSCKAKMNEWKRWIEWDNRNKMWKRTVWRMKEKNKIKTRIKSWPFIMDCTWSCACAYWMFAFSMSNFVFVLFLTNWSLESCEFNVIHKAPDIRTKMNVNWNCSKMKKTKTKKINKKKN